MSACDGSGTTPDCCVCCKRLKAERDEAVSSLRRERNAATEKLHKARANLKEAKREAAEARAQALAASTDAQRANGAASALQQKLDALMARGMVEVWTSVAGQRRLVLRCSVDQLASVAAAGGEQPDG